MRYLSLRPAISFVIALGIGFGPHVAFARDMTYDNPPAPPAPPPPPIAPGPSHWSDAGPGRNNPKKKLRLDDPSKPGVTKVEIPTYEDANPSAVKRAATKTREALKAAHAGYQEIRRRNAERIDQARQTVANQVYDKAKDPKVPIPQSRALDIPRFQPSPYGPTRIAPPAKIPAQPALVDGTPEFRSIPRFARDGGKVLSSSSPLDAIRNRFGAEQRAEMGKRLHDVIIGKRAFLDFKRVELAGGAATTAQVMADMPNQVLTFGVALGAAAAYNLYYYHGDNPLAWQKYTEEMTDPVGWLGIAGFSLAMAPVTTLLSSERIQRTGFVGQAPIFVSALALGVLVQNGIATFASDKDVKACLGFTNLANGYARALGEGAGSFNDAKDPAACDRALDKVTSGALPLEVFMQSVPSMAAVAVSGTLTYAVLYGVQKYVPLDRILTAIGITVVGSSPTMMVLRGVYSLGMTALFLYLQDKTSDPLTTWWDDWRLASLNKEGPLYANTIQKSRADLFATWERVRASGWADPLEFGGKDVCKDPRRLDSPYYDCAKPRDLDFRGAFLTYAQAQADWRQQQLKPVLQTWRDWVAKVTTYRNTFDISRDFYKDAIEKLLYSRRNPQAPADDKKTFTLANLEVKTSSAWPNFLRSIVARLDYFPSQDGTFGHVSTPRTQERLLTLLACGPNATGTAAGGVWSAVGKFTSGWITGNWAPDQMVNNAWGGKAEFFAPRITKPLDGTSDSACQRQFQLTMQHSPLEFMWMRLDALAPSTLDKVVVNVGDKRYVGLVDYIKDNVREDVILPEGLNNFDAWWAAYVTPQDDRFVKEIETEYQTHMTPLLKSALQKRDYYWCESDAVSRTPLGRYVTRIMGMGGDCGPDQSHRLAYGPMNSLRDQTALYLGMMVDLYVSNWRYLMGASDKRGATVAENQVIVPAQEALAAYDQFTRGMIELTDNQAIATLEQKMNEKMAVFIALVLPAGNLNVTQGETSLPVAIPATPVKIKTTGKTEVIPARPRFQAVWMRQLAVGLFTSLAEWQGYAKVAAMEK